MKVELKKLRHYPRLSKETMAFNADVYIDDEKAGTAENTGKGAPTMFEFADLKLEQKFYKFCRDQPPTEFMGMMLKQDSDGYVNNLIINMLEAKQPKKPTPKQITKLKSNMVEAKLPKPTPAKKQKKPKPGGGFFSNGIL